MTSAQRKTPRKRARIEIGIGERGIVPDRAML
jgi:hypothetical protein